jgi:hypothetical protein
MSGEWSGLVYIGMEELPHKLQIRKALPIFWSEDTNNTLHTFMALSNGVSLVPTRHPPIYCLLTWGATPLPLSASFSSGYLNPSLKLEVCVRLPALADTAIRRQILGMALIREIHCKWDEMVAREMERRLILLRRSDNGSRNRLLKTCLVHRQG